MNTEQFNKIVDERCEKIKSILSTKATEYAVGTDRLHNFNRGSRMSGISREKVLYGFMLKHEVALLDTLDKMDNDILPSETGINERIGDIINYYILLEASIKEKINSSVELTAGGGGGTSTI